MEQSLQPFQIGQAQLGLNRGQLEFEQQRKMVPLQDLQTNFSMQKTQYDIGTLPAMAATPCFDSN